MSQASIKQSADGVCAMIYDAFREKRGEGPIHLDELVDFTVANKLLETDAKRAWRNELRRRLHRWANRRVYKDAQKRVVRAMHAAKYPVTKNGQMTFETLWDDHLTMSAEHALKSFTQREDQIEGAKRRLLNDVDSFNDNNPNAADHKIQLHLHFEPVNVESEQETEEIMPSDATIMQKPLPR